MNEIKKILLPIDFSDASSTLLEYGVYLAEKDEAQLAIVYVSEDPFTYSGLPLTDYSGLPLTDIPFNQLEEDMTKYADERMERFLKKDKPPAAARGGGCPDRGDSKLGEQVEMAGHVSMRTDNRGN